MCGFAGFISSPRNRSRSDAFETASRMNEQLNHRGPDSKGIYVEPSGLLALTHRRLSIIDLSENGAQPMYSENKRYILVFNGEIYNHYQIRKNLDHSFSGISWKGKSDTETLLKSIQYLGIKKTLTLCEGMFAFALYDALEKKILLARDRLGEKPLYFGWQGSNGNRAFLFASELKAIKQHSSFEGRINTEALNLLLRHNYIPAPFSIYEDIHKLEPGCLYEVDITTQMTKQETYWDIHKIATAHSMRENNLSEKEVVDYTEELLMRSITQQVMSDVPIGAFLSGGIDSSLVTAIMQKQSLRPINTFTIGFEDVAFNEARSARQIAKYLGTDHNEFVVTAEDAMATIPRLSEIYCEPFADSSQIPTILLCEMAKQKVTVALSGDGGDELFGGYSRYLIANKTRKKINFTPQIFKKIMLMMLKENGTLGTTFLNGKYKNKVDKIIKILESSSDQELYNIIVSGNIESHLWMHKDIADPQTPFSFLRSGAQGTDFQFQMSLIDLLTYLPDDILTKVDRAAMSVSLETRLPILDHNIVEFAMNLPSEMKHRYGKSKWPLRQVLRRYIPEEHFERPKKGFSVPIASWLQSPMIDWADDLLSEETISRQGFFDKQKVSKAWEDHRSGELDVSAKLWPILMFQDWLSKNA